MVRLSRPKISSWNRRIALAVVAVLAPTIALSFIQYRSLVELEEKTKAALHENLRQTLLGVARTAEEHFTSLAEVALLPIARREVPPSDPDQVAHHFAAVRQSRPEIDQLFVVIHVHSGPPTDNYVLLDTAGGFRRLDHDEFQKDPDVARALQAFFGANMLRRTTEQKQGVLFWQESETDDCCPTTGHKSQLYLFSPLDDAKNQQLFVGLTVSSRTLKDRYFPNLLSAALSSPESNVKSSDLGVSVLDDNRAEFYATLSGLKHHEATLAFAPVFPKMELAIGYRGTTLEAMARKNFYQGLLLTVFVLSLLVVGIGLTLRAAAREMKLAEAKATFVSNVSHELKTPLALIRLFAETLEMGRVKTAEKAEEYYRIINQESRRLTQLINNILDFARIEEGRREYRFANANVADVVEEVLQSYQYQITSAGFELTTEIAPKLPPVMIDRDALAQAVLNLLNNAIKYSADVKRITVRVSAADSKVAIEVADCGIGIPRSEQEKIFEKFYRVSTGLIHNTKGSGLGLALVKHIIAAHRGQITVESAPGKGSRFTILLPTSNAETAPSEVGLESGDYQVATHPHH
jgi:signal transduction histidine kinase